MRGKLKAPKRVSRESQRAGRRGQRVTLLEDKLQQRGQRRPRADQRVGAVSWQGSHSVGYMRAAR